jgi:hypothetical protein
MHKTPLLLALYVLPILFAIPAHAQPTDRDLLSTFCDAAKIKGATCEGARGYYNAQGSLCEVKLGKDRYSGRFIAYGNRLLVVTYQSGCEAHATDFGGSVVFEEISGQFIFRNFRPGAVNHDCLVQSKSAQEDVLVCATGHLGQGVMETGVARIVFTRDFDGGVSSAPDFFFTAEDSVGAYGANVVNCKEGLKYFEISKVDKGPRPQTVTAETSFADAATIGTACGKGFPKPKETSGEISEGEAYVPKGFEKKGKFVVDLVTRKVVPE